MNVLPALAATAIVGLMLLNALLHPYRDPVGWSGFAPVSDVPAFRGIWLSPVKQEAVARLRPAEPNRAAHPQSLFVAGPHPWLYFAWARRPVTSMFYLHYGAPESVFDIVADRLFRDEMPDEIVLPNRVPTAVHKRILQWASHGCALRTISLPDRFIDCYETTVRQDLLGDVIVLRRATAAP